MTTIGYARVSTTDQDLSIQETALRAAGCGVIRAEKRSGTATAGREQLQTVLEFLRPGDVLIVTRIDRLARSIGDLQDIVRTIQAKGATLPNRAAHRYQHRRRRVFPRQAWRVRRIRNESAPRASA
jgi:DNA invertase Pin-like site-specific DNA recombinase